MTQATVANFLLDVDELGGLLAWHKARPVPDRESIKQIARAIEDIRRAEVYNSRFGKDTFHGEVKDGKVIIQ